jgi:branched-chain amino acid transport system permease protein
MSQLPRGTAIALVVVLAALACVPLLGSDYLVDLATQIVIYVLFALSLNVLIGFSGNVSFGHAAYFAIGGYACAILLTTYDWPLVLAFPAAVVLSGLAAAAIGYFCVKLTDIYFAMLTLAFAMFVWGIAFKWREVTGGDDGFVGIDKPEFLTSRVPYFYFALVVVTLSTAALWVICHSAFGRTLVAVRENRVRAGFVGVDTRQVRHVAFIVAGSFAGIAGALFALYNNGMYTETAFWTESARVLIMVLLGGMYSFFGPALGAAVLYFLQVATGQYTEYWPTVLGVILLVILMFVPEGIVGLAKRVRGQFASARAAAPEPAPAPADARPKEA